MKSDLKTAYTRQWPGFDKIWLHVFYSATQTDCREQIKSIWKREFWIWPEHRWNM